MPESSSPSSVYVYKICGAEEWDAAVANGTFTGSPVDVADGFIHFSTSEQVVETAARHFSGRENLVLVAVDPGRIGTDLVWEPSRGGDLFPHLYAPLPSTAAVWVTPLPVGADGSHNFPALPGLAS